MTEYRENDADFEACFPVERPHAAEGIDVRELPRTRAVTLKHRGSYAIVFRAIKERSHEVVIPTREVYLRGRGLIFKGNPVTDIQIPIAG